MTDYLMQGSDTLPNVLMFKDGVPVGSVSALIGRWRLQMPCWRDAAAALSRGMTPPILRRHTNHGGTSAIFKSITSLRAVCVLERVSIAANNVGNFFIDQGKSSSCIR